MFIYLDMKASNYISERIQFFRLQKGVTQKDLAKKIGISRSQLANLEAGVTFTKIDLVYEICSELDVLSSQIFPSVEWYKANKNL